MTLVVILTVQRGALDIFRAFEAKAAVIMARYGGAIERAVVIPPSGSEGLLREVHVVTFPDEQAFAAYRADEDLKAASHLREQSVVKTEILLGEDGPDYGAALR